MTPQLALVAPVGDGTLRRLDDEQIRVLLGVHRHVNLTLAPRDMLRQLASLIAEVVGAKVVFAGRRDSTWLTLAESAATPALPAAAQPEWQSFDAVAGFLGVQVGAWKYESTEWTLVGLRQLGESPVVLMLEGDWTESTGPLLQLAQRLLGAERAVTLSSQAQLAVAAHRLTRALTRVSSERDVCEAVLRHIVRAVPSRIAAFALPTDDDRLAIVATHGYSRTLVEHVRIQPGVGVFGSVYQKKSPLRVSDSTLLPGLVRRPRYRTNSFLVLPVLSGSDVVGVVSVTDRADDGAFTRDDLSILRALIAPAALALSRERQRRHAQSYAHAAAVDVVSGLYNRRYFQARLEEELQRRRRTGDPAALLLIDIDDFKRINDRYGHVAGDTVIADIGEILRRSVRGFDVCARFGGEEFAVLMPLNSADNAASTAERIRQRIEAYRPVDPGLSDLRVTASIGLAVAADESDGRELVDRADRALYVAKRSGKNQLRIDQRP